MLIQKFKREAATLRDILYHRLYFKSGSEKDVIDQFHKLYYDSAVFDKTWSNTWWMGVPVGKCPLDLWIYQEMIYDLKPDLIIETGTYLGGSALYMASMCDLINHGQIVTVDIETAETVKARIKKIPPIVRPAHPRVTYLLGSSTAPEVIEKIGAMVKNAKQVLVVLDSDHTEAHVREELRLYSPWVTKGSYLVVEDTNINGHPVYSAFGPGPMEALDGFLNENSSFVIDKEKEKLLLTMNPRGYLKRVT